MTQPNNFSKHLKIFLLGDLDHFRRTWKQNETILYISLSMIALGLILIGAANSIRSVGFQGENFYMSTTADNILSLGMELFIPALFIVTRFFYPSKSYWVALIAVTELLLLLYISLNFDLISTIVEPNIFASADTYRAYFRLEVATIVSIELFGTFIVFSLIDNVRDLTQSSPTEESA
ncbi:MAG: hypothetical protein QNJ45_27905 [Ardenticatenaceae bacterium]|nr:hypothetical protein [Ardenticatenaceae bacterium]